MSKKRTLEDIEDEIKSLSRKRDLVIIEIDKHQKQLESLMEEYYSMSKDYVKIVCLGCSGIGYIEDEKKTKHRCPACKGKQFIWAKLYTEIK